MDVVKINNTSENVKKMLDEGGLVDLLRNNSTITVEKGAINNLFRTSSSLDNIQDLGYHVLKTVDETYQAIMFVTKAGTAVFQTLFDIDGRICSRQVQNGTGDWLAQNGTWSSLDGTEKNYFIADPVLGTRLSLQFLVATAEDISVTFDFGDGAPVTLSPDNNSCINLLIPFPVNITINILDENYPPDWSYILTYQKDLSFINGSI